MSVQTAYQDFKTKATELAGDGECVALVVNNSRAYVEYLWPGVNWTKIIASVYGARSLMEAFNPAYWTVEYNDHNNPNQLPPVGAVMVFDGTPAAGYTNQFINPNGHTGMNDGADGSGYNLFQQNAPAYRQKPNVTHYNWKFRPCIGWATPKLTADPTPAPPPVVIPGTHTIYLPPTTGPWHLYPEGGPYTYAAAGNHLLVPANFGGLTYDILADRGNGIYTIQSQNFGRGDLYTRGSDVIIK